MNQNPLDAIVGFLKQTDELVMAKSLLDTFYKYSTSLEQYDQLGRLYHDVKAYHSAITCADKTLALAQTPQQMYSARANLAKMYNHINNPDLALQYINANLSVNPNDYEAKMEQVFSHYLQGDLATSYAETKALLADPMTPENVRNRALFNSGSYEIDEGNFKDGIRHFIDVGHRIGIWNTQPLQNQWSGETIPDATIVILAEGGIGDEIINVRFMRHIEDRGMKAIWVSHRDDLVTVFNRNGFNAVHSINEIVPDDKTFMCYAFYLPILLDLDKGDLDIGNYLSPDPSYVEKWKQILPAGKKVALRWAGSHAYEQDLHRSLNLQIVLGAASKRDPNAKFISVQRDANMDELVHHPEVFDAGSKSESIEDLLACLSLCDYVMTSCTSVAHVAAASGVETYVYPPIACYYVWLGGGNDWYGKHVHVSRQTKRNVWDHVK